MLGLHMHTICLFQSAEELHKLYRVPKCLHLLKLELRFLCKPSLNRSAVANFLQGHKDRFNHASHLWCIILLYYEASILNFFHCNFELSLLSSFLFNFLQYNFAKPFLLSHTSEEKIFQWNMFFVIHQGCCMFRYYVWWYFLAWQCVSP